MDGGSLSGLRGLPEMQATISLKQKIIHMVDIILLFLAGIVCFVLFFKSIDFFENV
jgi:hypothetical protein